ncbi:formyltransferase family protein [Paenibacillus sp. MY03]|uniref:formyltransferase family protein n=1 Tax=Paenibacillus sp. MY03 TaxID=302980 RepID=UPI000B3BFBA5|nr:formyltransferase family protein [Paenibacillus sp. MY03]
MNTVFMTGSHPRHLYIARRLHEAGLLRALVIEQRESFVPAPPENLTEIDRKNFIRHFSDRDLTEHRFFDETISIDLLDGIPVLYISQEELNSQKVVDWIRRFNPDQLVSYGVHKLSPEIIDICPNYAWNIHGGLSPWYRGTVTLFWPFYFMKPNWAGMTIHRLSPQIDAGDIIHHSVPELKKGDGIHDVACRAVTQVAKDLVKILNLRKDGHKFEGTPQKNSGKLFLNSDWEPTHLRVIYQLFDNDIVDQFLDGRIQSEAPNLVRAFH